MDLTWKDIALWAASFVALVPLFVVLVARKRAGQFPAFTAYVGFVVLESITLFLTLKHRNLYSWLYWGAQVVELILQLAVTVEIARHVFKPFGRWASGARSFWIGACGVSLVAALGLTFVASPHAPTYSWAWVIKGNLFAMMLTCMISIAVLVTARQYGLAWRNHVIGLAQGWTLWAFIAFAVETCQSYFGYTPFYAEVGYIGELANLAAVVYWIFIFWQEEPSRVLSPEMRQILVEEQRRLDYYVAKVVSRPGSRRSL
jgi:hypothetical protein